MINTVRSRDKRIFSTGCAGTISYVSDKFNEKLADERPLIEEQRKMNDCYFENRDWRSCKKEVRFPTSTQYMDINS